MKNFSLRSLYPKKRDDRQPSHRVRLGGELLEDRTVPAFVPTGAETLVNTFTTSNQQASSMAMDSNGNFVVVWESENQFSGSSGKDIYAQRYNAAGTKVGAEFRVNTFTTNDQSGPDVAMDNNGNFVVVWTSTNQDTGNSTGVYGQRYNASGVAQGSEFRLNNVTQYDQLDPSISMDATGNFVVVWTSGTDQPLAFPAPQDGLGGLYGVYGARYNSAGTRLTGTEFRVNNTTAGVQGLASVASDSSGNFTVAWTSTGQESGNGDSSAVYFRRYNSAGTALTSEARVNQTTTGEQFAPEIGMNASGAFVITYASSQDDTVTNRNNTYARLYNSSGTATSNEFRVNTYLPGEQYLQSVAMDTAGNFVVAWSSGYDNVANPGPELQQDGNMYGVYFQRYFANGTTDGGEYRVNTFTTGNQWLPSIAMRASNGNFWISWSSFGQDAANGYGVYLEPYGPNTLPTAVTGGPYTVAEGNSLVLNGSSVDPDFGQTVTFSWDLNGDGVYGDATGATPTLTWSQLQALGINDGPGSRTVRVRTFDGFDTTTSASTTLTIINTAPTATISSQSAAVRGETISFTLTASDPSSVDQAASFTYQVDWNNDNIVDFTQSGGTSIVVSNIYTASGVYTARVRATDKDGGVGAWASKIVTVTRSRTAANPNNPSLTDLYIGGLETDDFIVAGAGSIFDSNAGPNSVFYVNFNSAEPIELFPSVTGKIVVYLQGGDDIFN
ncbi:hypothetical protein K2X85_11565, partial [bacterium]|nr:hypothetical protein [bacterium]